jgi:hypothetical protein
LGVGGGLLTSCSVDRYDPFVPNSDPDPTLSLQEQQDFEKIIQKELSNTVPTKKC